MKNSYTYFRCSRYVSSLLLIHLFESKYTVERESWQSDYWCGGINWCLRNLDAVRESTTRTFVCGSMYLAFMLKVPWVMISMIDFIRVYEDVSNESKHAFDAQVNKQWLIVELKQPCTIIANQLRMGKIVGMIFESLSLLTRHDYSFAPLVLPWSLLGIAIEIDG